MYIDRLKTHKEGIHLKISQLSSTKVLISLEQKDMKSFELEFDNMKLSDPHSKKIISRLLRLALNSGNIMSDNKTVLCEALPSTDGCVLLVSVCDKKDERKKYRIKRIKEYPCYKFSCVEDMLTAIEKLYNTQSVFYNNSAYMCKNDYYLVFDYPIVSKKARKILLEFAESIKASKTFVARLNESAHTLSRGNAISHIGMAL